MNIQNTTVHPLDLSTTGLCETYLLYRDSQSTSAFDVMYLSMLEDEINRRKQFAFNRREIEAILAC